ncbi:hypothetical protein LTR97_003900 [Elasticomyces elasticus]|uniref:Uncharacterized protein n=1 Tax=Elasticomyces elasticus TaxID=574655 RepID=A0AAN7VUL8_9PEZI|nr:hypothetical protein LTR97_003900 [Elasticomyces elasticus]
MADHLAATYLDRAHDAERTILQLKLELQVARAEVVDVKDQAAAEVQEVKDAAAMEKNTLLQSEDHYLTEAIKQIEDLADLRKSAQKDREKHMVEVAALCENFRGVEAEKFLLEAEHAELKKKLHQVEAERGATVDMFDELREKVEELESAARDREAESNAEMPNHQWGSARRGAWSTC